MSRRRVLTPPEITVWRAVAETITLRMPNAILPDAVLPEEALPDAVVSDVPAPPARAEPRTSRKGKGKSESKAGSPAPTAPSWQPPPQRAALGPQDVDRPTRRRVAAGRQLIEASLDLHGLRQADAHARLRRFLQDAHRDGLRFVLVVTGKGGQDKSKVSKGEAGASFEERGVLRRMVPLWLTEVGLAAIVIGFGEAGRTHGGGGALYVHLRNRDRRSRE